MLATVVTILSHLRVFPFQYYYYHDDGDDGYRCMSCRAFLIHSPSATLCLVWCQHALEFIQQFPQSLLPFSFISLLKSRFTTSFSTSIKASNNNNDPGSGRTYSYSNSSSNILHITSCPSSSSVFDLFMLYSPVRPYYIYYCSQYALIAICSYGF